MVVTQVYVDLPGDLGFSLTGVTYAMSGCSVPGGNRTGGPGLGVTVWVLPLVL